VRRAIAVTAAWAPNEPDGLAGAAMRGVERLVTRALVCTGVQEERLAPLPSSDAERNDLRREPTARTIELELDRQRSLRDDPLFHIKRHAQFNLPPLGRAVRAKGYGCRQRLGFTAGGIQGRGAVALHGRF
jgi:hypothetical protein